MNKIYKAKKIYILRLARVTEVEPAGLYKNGYTRSCPLPEYHMAKLVKTTNKSSRSRKTEYFKLVRGGAVFHDNHNLTQKGEIYVVEKTPLNFCLKESVVFVSEKSLLEIEDELNAEENDLETAEKSAAPQEKHVQAQEKSMLK